MPRKKKHPPLTEAQWHRVFELRCLSKRGLAAVFTKEDRALVNAAYAQDPKRYAALEPDVFNATVPFGSNVRWRK